MLLGLICCFYISVTDTAYTEKYMGLANSNDNYKGYDVSDKLQFYKNNVCL